MSKREVITTLTCAKCGEQVSGPDAGAVAETMARHKAKKHGKEKAKK